MSDDPISHLEDDDLMCAGFAVEIENRIACELETLSPEQRMDLRARYCKVCNAVYNWPYVLLPWYESAHRYRKHPDFTCTFESLGATA